jgi:hypothetical protein
MIKKLFAPILFLGLILVSCGESSTENEISKNKLKLRIKQMEDSIASIQSDPVTAAKIPNLTQLELINRLTDYYRAFPKDNYAADCLFKIHMKFGELNAHEKSVAYGDTLLNLFPNYKNKDFLLESMGSACDIYIEPRDTSKVRFYYEQLLKEKNVSESKKKDIRARLNRIDLTFDEYILKINSQLQ